MLFIDDSHRKKWLRAQSVYQSEQAVKRGNLPDELAEGARWLKEAKEMAQSVAELLREDEEMYAQCLHGLAHGPADKRDGYAEILCDLRATLAGRQKLIGFISEHVQESENALLDGQLGEAGDNLVLSALAAVPGLSLEDGELAGDDDDDEDEDEA